MISRRNFSLVEAVISAALLLTGIGTALSMFVNANREVGDTLAKTDAEMRSDRLSRYLRSALDEVRSNATLTLSDNGDTGGGTPFTTLEFRPVVGYDAVAQTPILDPARRIQFELDGGETLNNVDDDNDGFIDEGSLTFWVDNNNNGAFEANERIVLASNVASGQEEYLAGFGVVGQDFQIRLPSGANNPQSTDTHIQMTYTLLTREPSTGRVHLIDVDHNFNFRN